MDKNMKESLIEACEKNPWLSDSYYDYEDYNYAFKKIESTEELMYIFEQGNWAIRSGFTFEMNDRAYGIPKVPQLVKLTMSTPYQTFATDTPSPSDLMIIKKEAGTTKGLAGAVFEVKDPKGKLIGTFQTNSDGEVNIAVPVQGKYSVTEIVPPSGYQLDKNNHQDIIIQTGTTAELTFSNHKNHELEIEKIDAETGEPLANAVIKIELDGGHEKWELITDIAGKAKLSNLADGTYKITEILSPKGYILNDEPIYVKLEAGRSFHSLLARASGAGKPTHTIVIKNEKEPTIRLEKRDKETGLLIDGAEFRLSTIEGIIIWEGIVEDGVHIFEGLQKGWYVVEEINPPSGYIKCDEPKKVFLEGGKSVQVKFDNEKKPSLSIYKKDSVTGKPLEGVVFKIRKTDGETVGTYKTDRNGQIHMSNLENGYYIVRETKALKGYKMDEEPRTVQITSEKMMIVEYENKKLSGLFIRKVDSLTGEGIYNVEFRVYDFITNREVEHSSFYTDNLGIIDFEGVLDEGRYKIMETREADGYIRDQIPRTIEFRAGVTTEILWKNTPLMGQIQILKKSASDNEVTGISKGTPLEGAVFEVYHYKTGNLMAQFTTGHNGVGISKPLPIGRYTIKEVKAPSYYKLSDIALDVEIEFSTQIVKLEFLNEPANTGVSIKKTGVAETMVGNQIRYDFKRISNDSTVPLSDFFFRDLIPTNTVKLDKIITGTYNQSLRYKIMYKTNKNDYRVMADNLSTTKNHVIDTSNASLGMFSDEYVTEIMFVFGTVKAGFSLVEMPYILATVHKDLQHGFEFANRADIGGKHNGEWVIGNSTWVTIVWHPDKPKLPRTGY